MDETNETVKLCYTIHKYSSYAANYIPENIMVNSPSDQLSRWFTDSTTPSQYIMLKLKTPSIVETIKFGKYIKSHVSDLKKFQIFGGTNENNLSLLLTAGLKKDNSPEIFRLRHRTTEGLYLPIQYLKIVAMQSWGPAYYYSIWYVELMGKNHRALINDALDTIDLRKEEEAVRILLKHLRRRRYKDAFEALSRESGVSLEGPLQARLWTALVENADYKLAEDILDEAMREGEFDWYMSWQPYTPTWRLMSPCSSLVEALLSGDSSPAVALPPCAADSDARDEDSRNSSEMFELCYMGRSLPRCNKPGPRGGHQLVVDSTTGTLYLFGGWNGTKDLDDLWSFDTGTEQWKLLCHHSEREGGPSPRSCHKMVFDPMRRKLYTLGRYLDNAQRVPANMNSDLYSYCVESNTWSLLSNDTAAAGGPRLVFDHQMCLDADTHTIYVFGGRVLPANTEEVVTPQYSGLYAYYAATNAWQQLLPDQHDLAAPQPRVSHSMLFHPVQRRLYIFAGQRNKEHLQELWWWDPISGSGQALAAASAPAPAAGFTQRATLDPVTDEMFVLSGMSKEKEKRVYNTLWVLSLKRMTWSCVFRNAAVTPHAPRPRFAHQLVYDPVKKIHYLFGGNPGNQCWPRLRLDDLWALTLTRVETTKVLNTARALLRESRYKDLCTKSPTTALQYLRTEVRDALDHTDKEQVSRFQRLTTALFSAGSTAASRAGAGGAVCGEGLSPRRSRALCRRRRRRAPTADLAQGLAAVLGSDDTLPDPTPPFEDTPSPTPDTWDVGDDGDDIPHSPEWTARASRIVLYDKLSIYFRPSTVPPVEDITDLVKL